MLQRLTNSHRRLMHWPFLLPLFASLFYVAGALLIRRASDFGVGVWRTTLISNVTAALVFSTLLPLGGSPWRADLLWQPALVALLYVGGQALTFLALQRGDVRRRRRRSARRRSTSPG